MSDDRDVLVCGRLVDAGRIAPDSTVMTCDRCAVEVIVAPSSLPIIAQDVRILCMACAIEVMKELGRKPGVIPPSPDVIAELRSVGYSESDIAEMVASVERMFGPPERNQ